MRDDPLFPRAWSSPWPAGETGRHSPLGELDELIERASMYSDKSRGIIVGDLRFFQRDTVNVLASLGLEYRDLAAKADKIKFPAVGDGTLWPGGPTIRYRESDDPNVTSEVTLAGRSPKLSDLKQKRLYSDLARLKRLLEHARRRYLGHRPPGVRRAEDINDLKTTIQQMVERQPALSQAELCTKIDAAYRAVKKSLPIPRDWKKAGAQRFSDAYGNPKLKQSVETYLSKCAAKVKKRR